MGGVWGAWLAMGLMMLLSWTAVAAVVVAWLRTRHRDDGPPAWALLHHDAERILNERFAKGEIDEEEFTRRRDALRR